MRRALTRTAALVLAAAVAMIGSPSATAAPLHAAGPNDGFYSVPYDDTLLWVRTVGTSTSYSPATYADWSSQGFPAPRPAGVTYVKAPWLNTILGVPYAPGTGNRIPLWGSHTALTGAQWARAGYPGPQVTTNIPGYVLQYRSTPGDSTIWASIGSEKHALTLAEWIAAGQPQPISGTVPGPTPAPAPAPAAYRGWSTSPELFRVPADGSPFHKLTFAEWVSAGQPTPLVAPGGFYKLSWDATIVLVDPVGDDELVTAADWAHYDFPTPAVGRTIPGDDYCYDPGMEAVFYAGVTVEDYLTDDEVLSFLGVHVEDVEEC